ncbi:MAG: glycosyltransferase family 4 protein [Chloroflexi bacterium]|nr:glycosyltransferase family 4 protein [Chloroflexota bacterium]
MSASLRLLVMAQTLEPRDGWASYALGLIGGLAEQGVRPTVLLDRHAPEPALPVEWSACLSAPLAALSRPEAMLGNAWQVARHRPGADLLHWMVEPYVTAALPGLNGPYCITAHGTYGTAPLRQRWPIPWLFRSAMRRARRVFCVSEFTRQTILEKLPLDNLEVIHNGHAWPGPLGQSGRSPGSPLLLGVGALKERKGYHVAIRALARLRERYPTIRYEIVGDDSDRKYVGRLRGLIQDLGLERHVELLGSVDEQTLRQRYDAADVFLLSPINVGQSFEGYGIVYLEAGTHALPVVGSADCGAAEAIDDGATGLLAPQQDDEALAERVARLLDDPPLAVRLGAAGREKAERQRWSNVARRYLDAYERCLAR